MIRMALQRLGGCQVGPVQDLQLLMVPQHIAVRGFCCHLIEKRLCRAGAELAGSIPSG